MKKSISIVLCLVMLFSIFSVCGAAVNTADANGAMYVESSGFESGKITYTVYLKKNLNVTGAILRIKYDPAVLEPVKYLPADSPDAEDNDGCFFENDGAYVETDEYGDVTYPVPGVYVSGMFEDSDDTCSVGFVNMEGSDTGSTDKPFMSFKFNVVSSNRPITAVEFYCDEFTCSDENLNIPKSDAPQLFYTHETSTLDKIKFGSVYFLDEGLKFEWEESTGAAGYRVCKEIDGEMIGIADVPATQTYYIDETAEPFCISTYTVRALDDDGNLDSGLSGNISVFYNKPHDHIYSDWITDKEETCTEDGSKHIECTLCKVVLETATIEKKSHTKSRWITDIKATVYKPGKKHRECTVCGKVLETKTIEQLKCPRPQLKNIENTTTGVKITWGKVSGADSYDVYRKIKGGEWKYLDSVSKTYYTDKSVKSQTKYYYSVKTINEAGASVFSKSRSKYYLAAPTLKQISNTSDGVKITWSKIKNADEYRVYRKTGEGDWKYLGYTTLTYYTDTSAKSGTKYYYAIKIYDKGAGYSGLSSSLSIKYLADPTLKTPTSTKSGISLKWSKVTGAQGYVVYYKTGSGSYKKLATVKGNSKVSYTHTKAQKGKKYTYKVKAYYGKTYSAYSKTKTIKDKY